MLLLRTIKSRYAYLGLLIIDDKVFCYTLERLSVIIPAGQYPISVTYSPRFKKDLPFIDVPGRAGIRAHGGNIPSDSDGCVLVAYKKKTDTWIYQQAATDLTNLLKGKNDVIKIIEA